MRILQISNCLISFKNNQLTKKNNILEKRAYVESKTKELEDLSELMCLGALGTGFMNVNEQGLLKKPSNWCKAFVILAAGFFVAKCIKQIQLSKQYDKENNK